MLRYRLDNARSTVFRVLSVASRLGHSYLIILLTGAVLLGCTNSGNAANLGHDPLADKSFVTRQPCAAPCWYGLKLDQSTKEEVYATLRKLPFIDPSSIRERGSGWAGDSSARDLAWDCTHPKVDRCGGATLSHDRLKQLWYSVGYTLTFEQVVGQLGPPDYLDYGPWSGEAGGSIIFLYWPDNMVTVEYGDTKSMALLQSLDRGKGLPRNTPVAAIYYSTKEGFLPKPGPGEKRIPWPGFEP
jgi:hypothetical protein